MPLKTEKILIKANLGSRRVHPDITAKYLHIDDDEWNKIALDLVSKKVRGRKQIQYRSKIHQKIVRFMMSRGFTINETKKALVQTTTIYNTPNK